MAVEERSDFDYQQSKKSFAIGKYRYIPELNRKKPHNIVGFRIVAGNGVALKERFKVLSIEEYKCLIFPYAKAQAAIRLRSDDHAIYWQQELDTFIDGDLTSRLPAISKLAGSAYPCVVIETCWGGMNPDYSYEVIQLGKKTTTLAVIKPSHATFEFGDFGHKGRLQAAGYDPTFAYWNASGADSPRPPVILELTPMGWRLCKDIMRQAPAYPQEQVKDLIDRYNSNNEKSSREKCFDLSPLIWRAMLGMIYSGRAVQAWDLLDKVWPKGKLAAGLTRSNSTRWDFVRTGEMDTVDMTKTQFIREFRARLRQSPYWHDLRILNKGAL